MMFTHEEQELTLRIKQLRWEAVGVVSVTLERPDGRELPAWQPGAHLDLHLPGAITRQYSLCGRTADARTWRVAVLREPNGRGGSAAVHDILRPGDMMQVRGPRNNFALADSPDYLFIAGGIGITPLLPMIDAAEAAGARWRLMYGGRTRSSMAFLDVLAAYGERVEVWPQDELGLLDLDAALGQPRPDTLVYCCGPEPLLAAVEQACHHWPGAALHVERFAPKPQPLADAGAEAGFEVVLERSGRCIQVPPGCSVLEALEVEGVDAPNSCREGICGTCETKVLEGIPDHRDSLLSEEERSANTTMMICVGRGLSARLVLDL